MQDHKYGSQGPALGTRPILGLSLVTPISDTSSIYLLNSCVPKIRKHNYFIGNILLCLTFSQNFVCVCYRHRQRQMTKKLQVYHKILLLVVHQYFIHAVDQKKLSKSFQIMWKEIMCKITYETYSMIEQSFPAVKLLLKHGVNVPEICTVQLYYVGNKLAEIQ